MSDVETMLHDLLTRTTQTPIFQLEQELIDCVTENDIAVLLKAFMSTDSYLLHEILSAALVKLNSPIVVEAINIIIADAEEIQDFLVSIVGNIDDDISHYALKQWLANPALKDVQTLVRRFLVVEKCDNAVFEQCLEDIGKSPDKLTYNPIAVMARFLERFQPRNEVQAIQQALLQTLNSAYPKVVADAIELLGKMNVHESAERIADLLDHPEADVRIKACEALAQLKFADAVPKLIKLLEDFEISSQTDGYGKAIQVSMISAYTLKSIGTPQAMAAYKLWKS